MGFEADVRMIAAFSSRIHLLRGQNTAAKDKTGRTPLQAFYGNGRAPKPSPELFRAFDGPLDRLSTGLKSQPGGARG